MVSSYTLMPLHGKVRFWDLDNCFRIFECLKNLDKYHSNDRYHLSRFDWYVVWIVWCRHVFCIRDWSLKNCSMSWKEIRIFLLDSEEHLDRKIRLQFTIFFIAVAFDFLEIWIYIFWYWFVCLIWMVSVWFVVVDLVWYQ